MYIGFFLFDPYLFKAITYYLQTGELFWNVKMENEIFGQLQKNTRHKTGTYFKTQL